MKQALMERCTQNKACFIALEATGTSTIVETSSIDSLCGAAVGMNNTNLANVQLCKGENWIGSCFKNINVNEVKVVSLKLIH